MASALVGYFSLRLRCCFLEIHTQSIPAKTRLAAAENLSTMSLADLFGACFKEVRFIAVL